MKKHSASYAAHTDQQAHFTPLVSTTYQWKAQDDFVRLLWLIRTRATEDGRSVGEIREYAAIKHYRQQMFARLCARASITIARYTTARLSSLILFLPNNTYMHRAYVPSDPGFTRSYANVLTGIPIVPSFQSTGV